MEDIRTTRKVELKDSNKELTDIRKHKAILLNIQKNLIRLDEINQKFEAKNSEKMIEQEKIDSVLMMEQELKRQYPRFFNFEESNIKNLKRIQEVYREVRDVYEEIENLQQSQQTQQSEQQIVTNTESQQQQK